MTRTLRKLIHQPVGRLATMALMVATAYACCEPWNYLYALQVERSKEAQIREIARKMNVDPEFLLNPGGRRSFNFSAFFASIAQKLGFPAPTSSSAGSPQPDDVKEQIARVKSRYGLVAADTTLAKLAGLIEVALAPDDVRGKKKGQIKAELQSVLRLIDKDFLPPLDEGLPGVAASRDVQMRAAVNRMRQDLKAVLNAPHALDEKNLEATLASVRQVLSGSLRPRGNGQPRWTRDPFPVKDSYKKAPATSIDRRYGDATSGGSSSTTPAVVPNAAPPAAATSARGATTHAIASDVAALAAQLGTPAKAFAFVYDNIEWESYGGVAKGARGALHERSANDWDQALLLRDLLQAQGYQAQLEWGKVEMPVARAMNLVGTEDPLQAANLLATAGFDTVALVQNGTPIAVRMTHAWVRALIPYLPDRGTTTGTPDTWVRMDPSFKRYDYQPGIAVDVPWNESAYLQTSAVRPPNDFYADAIWAYIRANNLNCNNLAQVPKTGRIRAANYPFIPATLNTRVEQLLGLAAQPPASMMQTVSITITDPYWGDVLVNWSGAFADLWGKKVSITFPPATAEDAAIVARYGGLYNTPAYLVRLKAVISIDDQPVAQGGAVAAGADLSLDLSFREPHLGTDSARHDIAAGESMVEVFDSGRTPDSLIAERMERLQAIAAQPASDAQRDALLTEKLAITGLRYFQEVDDGIDFATGTQWHRWVKSAFEGLVSQRLAVTYNFVGQAIRVSPADRNIDVTRLTLGIIPIRSDLSRRLDAMALAGLQTSYLEGSIWEEIEAQQGISATKALLLSRMAGQTIRTANRTNVDSVLAATNLSAATESNIRGAVAQGRIAIIPSANIRVNRWVGTGYILRDPISGSATYPISGGFAGGSSTGAGTSGTNDTLGNESWFGGTLIGSLLKQYLAAAAASGQSPSSVESDPVNVSTGNMFRSFNDLAIMARMLPVALGRTYNSRSTYNGPFGHGWTFTYGESVTRNPDGSLTYRESDGTEHRFAAAAGGFTAPPGKHIDVTVAGSETTLRFSDGTRHLFDANGLLVRQTDLNGNSITIERDAAGNPLAVIDATGRTMLTFTLTAGKITQVTDPSGRNVQYAYDGDDLVRVTDTAGKPWTMAYDLAHNLTQLTDPAGNMQSYDYDVDDRMFHHVDANGAEEYFHYDIAGRHTVLTDRRGGDNLIEYDDRGRALERTDAAGNMVRASYDAANNQTSLTDSRGGVTTFEHDENGNVTRQVNPDQGVVTATYDSNSRLLTGGDTSGMNVSNSYDAAGNLLTSVSTVAGVTQTSSNTYDTHGQLSTSTDANGNVTSYTWAPTGTVATQTDGASNTTTFSSDGLGRITSIRDPGGNTITVTYDARDRILTSTDPHGNTATMTYDDLGRQTALTTARGTTRYTYDGEGRLLSTTDVLGNKSTITYNAAGDVLTRTDARGNTTAYTYDAAGRVLRIADGAGHVWTYGYCASIGSRSGGSCSTCGGGAGEGETFCELADPTGGTLKNDFDVMGRVATVTDALGNTVQMQYDTAGRKIVEIDANGNGIRYAYDIAGRLASVTEASGAVTSFTYDKNGNKLSQRDANGNVRRWEYDALNRVVKEIDPLQRTRTFAYDSTGNLITAVDAKNQTVSYTYERNRLVSVQYPDNSTETYTYDALGRRLTAANANGSFVFTYDLLDRVTSVRNTNTNFTATYEYDALGNRTKMTTPAATVSYVYDAKNRIASMTDSIFGKFTFVHDALDRRTAMTYPNGVTTSYLYDNGYRLSATVAKDAAGTIVDTWSYQYDRTGNRTARIGVDGRADTYVYDAVSRLREANYPNGERETFSYDLVGNRLTRTDESGTLTSYTYDAANQVLQAGNETFGYDANGNMLTRVSPRGTTTLTYDFLNRITNIAGPDGAESSKYGPDGRRTEMTSAAAENVLLRPQYDLSWNPIADLESNNAVKTYRLYAPGMDEPLAEWRRANNRITFLHHDAIGSITAVTQTDARVAYRQSYAAFGRMSRTADPSGIPPTRLGFTGRENSVGSLMQYRSRYYDSSLGRFASQDSYAGDILSPPSLHRYTYASNNPVRFIDPLGLFCIHEVVPMRVTPNFIRPEWAMIPSLYALGVCVYTSAMLFNAYLYILPMGFTIAGLGGGYLWPHITIRGFPTGNPLGGAPYTRRNVFSWHIGLLWMAWKVCLIVYDVVSSRHIIPPLCIPYWLILLAVVLWYTLPYIILAAQWAVAAAPELVPVFALAI